jgi:hypothetical protein
MLAHRLFLLEYADAERHGVDRQADHKSKPGVQCKREANELRENVEKIVRVANPPEKRMRYQHMVPGDHQLHRPQAEGRSAL